jgi:hypothetical protein
MTTIILDSAVSREKAVQYIGAQRKLVKFMVTLLEMRYFSTFLGTSRACANFRDPTTEFRIITNTI